MSVGFLSVQQAPFQILGRNTVDSQWNGSPLILKVNENANMPQTPAGTVILAWQNEATQNNLGELAVTSGGDPPVFKYAQALANQPSIWLHNWTANNLSITNVSGNDDTPIRIQAIGPGIPGTTPKDLAIGPPGIILRSGDTAQGAASPQYMQLVIQSNSSTLGILGVIGGPQDDSGNNGYVFAVNDVLNGNTGPGTGKTPPEGYYATTTGNTYTFSFNWGSSLVFVANLSPETAHDVTVIMRKL